jgi:hypothetical protein
MSAEITNGITKKKAAFEVGKAALVDKIVSLSLSLVPPRRVFWFLQGTPFLLPPGVLTLTLRVPERSTGGPPAGLHGTLHRTWKEVALPCTKHWMTPTSH